MLNFWANLWYSFKRFLIPLHILYHPISCSTVLTIYTYTVLQGMWCVCPMILFLYNTVFGLVLYWSTEITYIYDTLNVWMKDRFGYSPMGIGPHKTGGRIVSLQQEDRRQRNGTASKKQKEGKMNIWNSGWKIQYLHICSNSTIFKYPVHKVHKPSCT